MIVQLQMLGSVALAMVLGALIGLERELADRPAGLRTHMLVSGAAAFFVALSNAVVADFDIEQSVVNTDPIRVIEAVVAGISFLGAGTIFRHRGESRVEGLTTAASLLFVGAVGVSVAVNRLILAIGATVLVLVVLRSTYWFGLWKAQRTADTNAKETTRSVEHEDQ